VPWNTSINGYTVPLPFFTLVVVAAAASVASHNFLMGEGQRPISARQLLTTVLLNETEYLLKITTVFLDFQGALGTEHVPG